MYAPAVRRSLADVRLDPIPPLDEQTAAAVVEALRPQVTDERAARIEEVLASRLASLTLVLDRFHDPHNAGAVLRSADAFGLAAVHAVETVEPFAVARRATQGADKWVDVVRHSGPAEAVRALKSEGFSLHVAAAGAQGSAWELPPGGRLALVFGNEHDGVDPVLRAAADGAFSIPMRGFVESFNVSVAVALSLGAAAQGRAGDLSDLQRARLRAAWYRRSVRAADAILARRGVRA